MSAKGVRGGARAKAKSKAKAISDLARDLMPKRRDTTVLKINTEWLSGLIARKGLTQLQLARKLNLSTSLMNKLIHGGRGVTLADVANLASSLGVSADEVLTNLDNLGFEAPRRGAVITGKLTGECRVSSVIARKGSLFPYVDAPVGSEALIADTKGTALDAYHGAAFVYSPALPQSPVTQNCNGHLCVVEADDHFAPFVGTLKKNGGGSMMLELFASSKIIEVRTVHRASRIVGIYFPP